ncbi:cytochrome p450 83b1 [Phtheirospermum japonicum]|uniref:Cytochrome p450 83b1 n=1 Tax=Phtheirospermum japonicum TaxID=374723 RepID=A0A830BGT9_9LAMI|nr:cytochrome p450 83b1 [Phtheirospermum japonicum]
MILHLLLISLPIIIFLYFLHKNRNPIKTLVPPGPPGLPLIGNIHQLASVKTPHVYLWQLSKKYGPLIHMTLGSKQVFVISSAKLAKQVFKTQDTAFSSRPKHLGQQTLSYNRFDITFSPYNNYWREVRKIAVINLFSLKKLQSFRPIREDEMSRLMAKISGFASSNQAVDLSETTIALGSTLISRIAFGKRYDEHGSEMQRFDELELIDEHLSRNKKVDEEEDILDILIQLKEQKDCSVDLTWDNIKALLLNIFVAAADTSAVSIVWTMTALIKAPHVMKKAQAEIRNSIGKKGTVDEDDLPSLSYLKALIKESFRMYPPAPLLIRETIEKCTLDSYEVQPKTTVFINSWAIARDPEYWGDRPHEFLPERFLNSDIDIKGQDFGVVPFGSGRRVCPGMLMGLANVELTVANLLYAFDWELPQGVQAEDVDTEALPGLAVHKKNPLLLVPKKYVA